jgi:hypothetical protein
VDKVQEGSQEMQNVFEEFLMGWKRVQYNIKSPIGQLFSKQDHQTNNYWLWKNLINIPLQKNLPLNLVTLISSCEYNIV